MSSPTRGWRRRRNWRLSGSTTRCPTAGGTAPFRCRMSGCPIHRRNNSCRRPRFPHSLRPGPVRSRWRQGWWNPSCRRGTSLLGWQGRPTGGRCRSRPQSRLSPHWGMSATWPGPSASSPWRGAGRCAGRRCCASQGRKAAARLTRRSSPGWHSRSWRPSAAGRPSSWPSAMSVATGTCSCYDQCD